MKVKRDGITIGLIDRSSHGSVLNATGQDVRRLAKELVLIAGYFDALEEWSDE